jgi:hypothetical protein
LKRLALAAHAAAAWVLVASVIGAALLVALDPARAAAGWAIVGVAALLVVVTGVLAGIGVRRTAAAFGLLLLYFAVASTPASLQPVVTLALFGASMLYAERASGLIGSSIMSTGGLSPSGRDR